MTYVSTKLKTTAAAIHATNAVKSGHCWFISTAADVRGHFTAFRGHHGSVSSVHMKAISVRLSEHNTP